MGPFPLRSAARCLHLPFVREEQLREEERGRGGRAQVVVGGGGGEADERRDGPQVVRRSWPQQGRKEGRKWLGLICVAITLSLNLHFAEKATLQKCMIHPFCILCLCLHAQAGSYTPYIQGWLSVTAAERAPPGREGGQLAW